MNSLKSKGLRIGWCDRKAATFAVMNWHYSKCMPKGRLITFGAWEDGKFVGSVIFGRGAIHNIGKPFGVAQAQACELVRIALGQHAFPVSKILAICLRMLKKQSSGLRVIVSFADSQQGHYGGIYQATNWVCVGQASDPHLMVKGVKSHPRAIVHRYGTRSIRWLRANVDAGAQYLPTSPKFKYAMPLDQEMKLRLNAMRIPYPKRATSIDADAPTFQVGEGGSRPTVALHSSQKLQSCSGMAEGTVADA